jgi:hypothetical protein
LKSKFLFRPEANGSRKSGYSIWPTLKESGWRRKELAQERAKKETFGQEFE